MMPDAQNKDRLVVFSDGVNDHVFLGWVHTHGRCDLLPQASNLGIVGKSLKAVVQSGLVLLSLGKPVLLDAVEKNPKQIVFCRP